MSDELNHNVPRRLDDPAKFLFWTLDVAAIAGMGLGIGVLSGYIITGLVVGAACALLWQRFSSGNHGGLTKHFLFWLMGWPDPNKTPSSHYREFNR